MITLYESNRLIQLIRDKNKRIALNNTKGFTYNKDTNKIENIEFKNEYKGLIEKINLLPRLLAKRNVKKLIETIHNSGGIAVLAHPACYWALSLEKLVKDLINDGLDGIEVYYPYPHLRSIVKFHTSEKVKKIANKYPQLIKTGGTDFHGEIF